MRALWSVWCQIMFLVPLRFYFLLFAAILDKFRKFLGLYFMCERGLSLAPIPDPEPGAKYKILHFKDLKNPDPSSLFIFHSQKQNPAVFYVISLLWGKRISSTEDLFRVLFPCQRGLFVWVFLVQSRIWGQKVLCVIKQGEKSWFSPTISFLISPLLSPVSPSSLRH